MGAEDNLKQNNIKFDNPKVIVIVIGILACAINLQFFCIFLLLIIALILLEKRSAEEKLKERIKALEQAEIFLEPYNEKNILGNLKLTNNFCSIYLHRNEHVLAIKEKVKPYRECVSPYSDRALVFETWNRICATFSHTRKYEDLVLECETYGILTAPVVRAMPLVRKTQQESVAKVDINNCSMIEITNLPGINIVLSKRIIQKREEIGGFKSTKEFFDFINLKPHFEKKLKEQIYINKMKGTLNIKQTAERSVDF